MIIIRAKPIWIFDGAGHILDAERPQQARGPPAELEEGKSVPPMESDVASRPRAVIITMPGDEVALAVELPQPPFKESGSTQDHDKSATTAPAREVSVHGDHVGASAVASSSSSRSASITASASGSQSGPGAGSCHMGANASTSTSAGEGRAAQGRARAAVCSWSRNAQGASGPRGSSTSSSSRSSAHVTAMRFWRLVRVSFPTSTVVDTLPT